MCADSVRGMVEVEIGIFKGFFCRFSRSACHSLEGFVKIYQNLCEPSVDHEERPRKSIANAVGGGFSDLSTCNEDKRM